MGARLPRPPCGPIVGPPIPVTRASSLTGALGAPPPPLPLRPWQALVIAMPRLSDGGSATDVPISCLSGTSLFRRRRVEQAPVVRCTGHAGAESKMPTPATGRGGQGMVWSGTRSPGGTAGHTPPDLCPGRPSPRPLLGTARPKTVLKAMPPSFAVLTDLRGPERQCPAHSPAPPEAARPIVVGYLPTAVRARPRPMPPATHTAPRSSAHCSPYPGGLLLHTKRMQPQGALT